MITEASCRLAAAALVLRATATAGAAEATRVGLLGSRKKSSRALSSSSRLQEERRHSLLQRLELSCLAVRAMSRQVELAERLPWGAALLSSTGALRGGLLALIGAKK